MRLFNKLFGKQGNAAQIAAVEQNLPSSISEQELMDRYAGNSFDKQLAFGEAIGSNNWEVDMAKGTLNFGLNLTFPMQALGTISHSSQTWLWAWANTKSGLSDNIVQQALALKKYGEQNGIDLFTISSFDCTKEDLHKIGLIASGMFDASAYYIADYGQGALLATLKSEGIDKLNTDSPQRILNVFPQLISTYDLNHRIAFANYLRDKGYDVTEDGNSVSGVKRGSAVIGQFDRTGRLISLNG